MAIVTVKSITTIHPTTISIMRVMLTAPSVVAGDVSEIVSGVLELLSGIFVVDSVDLVGLVVLGIESIPPESAGSGVTGLLSI